MVEEKTMINKELCERITNLIKYTEHIINILNDLPQNAHTDEVKEYLIRFNDLKIKAKGCDIDGQSLFIALGEMLQEVNHLSNKCINLFDKKVK